MSQHHLANATVWIIGASSGIGAATAAECHRRGAQVAISARRTEQLQSISAGDMYVVPFDATDQGATDQAWRKIKGELGVPDIVIFCAGMWKQTPPATFSASDFRAHIDVHLGGLANIIDRVLPEFVARQSGVLATVSSVAGYRGIPGGEYYGAVKAAQINLFEALRGAVRKSGVDVTTICPGFVETDMTQGNSFPMPFKVSPERAAREICDGIEAGKPEIVFPRPMAALMKASRYVPVRAWAALTAKR